jgi:hypothetical protein
MTRALVFLLTFAFCVSSFALAQEKGKETTLRSGRKIWMLHFDQIEVKDDRGCCHSGWMMTYRTTLNAKDPELEREIDEIWRLVKARVERMGYKDAMIEAVTRSASTPAQDRAGVTRSLVRQADGSWKRVPFY